MDLSWEGKSNTEGVTDMKSQPEVNVDHSFFVFCFRTLSDRSGGEGGDGGRMDRKSSTPVSTRYHRQISPLLVEEGTPPPPGNPRRTKFRCY
jgi:hypothetical protein